jgi:hypothetical protein
MMSRVYKTTPILMLVLSGVAVTAFFSVALLLGSQLHVEDCNRRREQIRTRHSQFDRHRRHSVLGIGATDVGSKVPRAERIEFIRDIRKSRDVT